MTRRIITLDINLSDSIENIKQKIQEKENILPEYQRLSFSGKQLENGHILSDYNVKKNSLMHLGIRLI